VDISNQLLIGRPYGGTAILFRKKNLSNCVSTLEAYDPRLTAIRLTTNIGPVMLVCVYMPSDVGDLDCVLNYNETCSKINALYAESDVAIVAGDFNCQTGSRFYNIFFNFVQDCGLEISDSNRLLDEFTFCSDDALRTSWIDHIACSSRVDELVHKVEILHQFASSDHKPLLAVFSGLTSY